MTIKEFRAKQCATSKHKHEHKPIDTTHLTPKKKKQALAKIHRRAETLSSIALFKLFDEKIKKSGSSFEVDNEEMRQKREKELKM